MARKNLTNDWHRSTEVSRSSKGDTDWPVPPAVRHGEAQRESQGAGGWLASVTACRVPAPACRPAGPPPAAPHSPAHRPPQAAPHPSAQHTHGPALTWQCESKQQHCLVEPRYVRCSRAMSGAAHRLALPRDRAATLTAYSSRCGTRESAESGVSRLGSSRATRRVPAGGRGAQWGGQTARRGVSGRRWLTGLRSSSSPAARLTAEQAQHVFERAEGAGARLGSQACRGAGWARLYCFKQALVQD